MLMVDSIHNYDRGYVYIHSLDANDLDGGFIMNSILLMLMVEFPYIVMMVDSTHNLLTWMMVDSPY